MNATRCVAMASTALLPLTVLCDSAADTTSFADKVKQRTAAPVVGATGAITRTPLIKLPTLSAMVGSDVLLKAELQSVGGSVKDRPALFMLDDAEARGVLKRGDEAAHVVESTGGNTGVGLAVVCAARGYKLTLVMPSNVSKEKQDLMRLLGANVITRPPVPYSNHGHYYHFGKALAAADPNAFYVDQFENPANGKAHFMTTGPEIWDATGGKVDAFICASGTGGTISGTSRFLKQQSAAVRVFLIDPPGSSLSSYVRRGKLEASPGSTTIEGIGIGRLTKNFQQAIIDGSFDGTDDEAIAMAYWLARNEGIWVGPSAALNVVGAVKVARMLGPGHTIVTVGCDGGERYASKLYNDPWLEEHGYSRPEVSTSLDFVK